MPKPTAAANATPMPEPTRRAFLKAGGALGTVAALAVPVALLPKAEASSIDPVFAAINEFRAKRAALYAVLKVQEDYENRCAANGVSFCAPSLEDDAIEEMRDAASAEDAEAWQVFLRTAPTTREGLWAYLALLTDLDGYGGGPVAEKEDIEAICGVVRSFVMGGHYA